jgi:site-specific DNA recombinase
VTVRVATYTRISTDEEHQPYSLEAQDERLRSYIRSQEGWELARQFTDQMSGSVLERPGLQRALAEARAQRYDLLLVYRVDRLARSVRGLSEILHALDNAGAVFRSATEPFDTGSPPGRMMVQMLGVFAEFERATIIDRVIAGMERKAARGGWTGGPVPYGYRFVPRRLASSDGQSQVLTSDFLEVDPDRSPIVQVIFDLYANKRLGSRAIANWLTERGHRPSGGRPWSFRSVLTILRNRVYVGEVFFRAKWHSAPHPLWGTETPIGS